MSGSHGKKPPMGKPNHGRKPSAPKPHSSSGSSGKPNTPLALLAVALFALPLVLVIGLGIWVYA